MDLRKAIKSVNILNIDWDESTASKDTFLLKEENDSSFIVSDADEEILILIEFVDCVDLHNIIFTALPLNDNDDTSPPKKIHLYKATNVCVNFDDMSSLSADKVIEGKAKKLSKGQKVSLRKKLAFRQIKYLIIYVRANQNDSEKTHLHKIKINGTCDAKLNENKQQIIKTFDESKYIQRIDELFEKQQSNKMSDENFYDFVCSKYPNENIAHFLNDYHKFIKNMDSNETKKYLRQRNAVCSKKNCVFMKRQNRFKRIESGNKQSMIRQRLRQIHILSHQYDEEQKMKKNDKNYRQQMVKEKKAECEDMDEKEPQSNKFVTDFGASSTPQMDGKYLNYSQGFKFYYHSLYRDKGGNRLEKEFGYEFMPNRCKVSSNKHSAFKDWYVSPKYNDLKEEIVYGGHLTLDQFESEISKAEVNICSDDARELVANGRFLRRYNVQTGSAITVDHMLCVMLYTNYDVLQNNFSKTFRKLLSTESDEQLKERHTAFVHLSRLITEAIWCFGNSELDINVYHGVNASTIFESFTVLFCGPTSTTTSESIAIKFAKNNGTVITMQRFKGCTVSNHFDCELWSDYPWEREKLFIGMNSCMSIVNVHDLRNDIVYEEWIVVIRALSHLLINGTDLKSSISQFVEEIHLLIDSVKNNSVKSYVPEYIVDTFNHIRTNAMDLAVDLNLLSKEIYWKHKHSDIAFYGGKKIKNIYFDQDDNIKWAFINSLLPNLRRVQVVSSIPDEENANLHSFSNSILLTDDVLNDIFVFLQGSNIGLIHICSPQNNEYSLKQQATKFSGKYKEIGYHFKIMQNVKLQRFLNQCDVFVIERVSGH